MSKSKDVAKHDFDDEITDWLQDMIDGDLAGICIIFGKPRKGKTAFMSYIAEQIMHSKKRYLKMCREIHTMHNIGKFPHKRTPLHCLVSNYTITRTRPMHRRKINRKINPYRLGFANQFVETHLLEPYTGICVTEGQKYWNSRMSSYLPDWQFRFFEQLGHMNYNMFIDVQRMKLIDVNIRDISYFIEIRKMKKIKDQYNRVIGIKWLIRKFEDSDSVETYLASGRRDKTCYTEHVYTADFNVLGIYNSKNCKPKFYDGHMNHNSEYDTKDDVITGETFDDYLRYLRKNDDELPYNFYKNRSVA